MMNKNRMVLIVAAIVMFLAFTACSKNQVEGQAPKQPASATPVQAAQQMVLKDYGPTDIKAGKNFNKQTAGYSAIWIHGDNLTPNTIVVINGVKLKGNKHKEDPSLLSTEVPEDLYQKPAEYPIYLLDTATGAKSNELKFVVK